MFFLRCNVYLPFWLLVGIEVLWILYFFSLVWAFQFSGGAELLRTDLILSAFHAGAPYVVLNALEHDTLMFAPFFWALFAAFTDTWSVINAYKQVVGIGSDATYIACLQALTTIALILSVLTCTWYGIVLSYQYYSNKREQRTLKALRDEEGDDDFLRMLPHAECSAHGKQQKRRKPRVNQNQV
jgi:signal transduction histidine kinase